MSTTKYEVRVVSLAIKLRERLSHEDFEGLYYSIRRQIYGVPGPAIPLSDLLHVLAEIEGWPDPSNE